MSSVVVERPAERSEPGFLRVLWWVLVGYLGATVTLGLLALALEALGLLPRPYLHYGPFPVSGPWSFDADLVAAATVVLVAAWWIRSVVAGVTGAPVSFPVVAAIVAVTGYAPFLALRPIAISGVLALPATTWLVRRYAVGRTLPFPRPSWRMWAGFAAIGLLVFGSYGVYHPLISPGTGVGGGSSGPFRVLTLENSGFADLGIVRVEGGALGAPWTQARAQQVVRARSSTEVFIIGPTCRTRVVAVTYTVLGRTTTQRFEVRPEGCNR